MRPFAVLAVFVALLLADSGPGFAHRLNLFAYADGTTIVGSAYFSGGGVPEGAGVVAYGADGRVLGRTTTGGDGGFTLEATARVDHRLTVETADGHAAAFILPAGELPASLPVPEGLAAAAPTDGAGEPAAATAEPAPALPAGLDAAALDAAVARAVQQQIQPLRQELAAASAEVRLRDILGGIGYILGLFGIAAYLLSLRRTAAAGRRDRPGETATAE